MKSRWPKKATARQRKATEELLRRIYAKYSGRILSAVLFGSVARGDFTPDSDIDVLVVANKIEPGFKWDVWGIGSRVSLEHDVIFNLHIYSRQDWESLRAKKRAMWRNVEQEGIKLELHSPQVIPAV